MDVCRKECEAAPLLPSPLYSEANLNERGPENARDATLKKKKKKESPEPILGVREERGRLIVRKEAFPFLGKRYHLGNVHRHI